MRRYNPKEIEPRWQAEWEKSKIYQATEDVAKPKKYILEYFPYPSGAAMHVGHVRNYTIGDAIARHGRMSGYNVLHPMGWDAFGLPAENYAMKNKVSPQKAIEENTARFKKQLMQMGFSYDWSREINSSDPDYYRWTQWFFLLLYKKGLAYQKEALVNWDPVDKTVLANEQVIDGKADRSGAVVEKKALKQWFFKITDYADRLVADLDDLNWSEAIKSMQRNWIGRSTGAEVDFKVDGSDETIKVFTTRPDTLFGATFMVLAPEHPLVIEITDKSHKTEVEAYIKQAGAKSDIERQETERDKTGVFTGAYAINPANNQKVPVWIADYVLYGYGTGAIMAVPAHDERDYEFAKKFDLPVQQVIARLHIDNERPFDKSSPVVERQAAQALVKHPDDDLYLMLNLKGWDEEMYSLPIGGIDDGEKAEEGALRELKEETGYTDISSVEPLNNSYVAEFYHALKKENRRANISNFFVQLKSLKQVDVSAEEASKHEIMWVGLDELHDKLSGQGSQRVVEDYRAGGQALAGEGLVINSDAYDGLSSSEMREKIVINLAKAKQGEEKVNYKIRDWLISRQRYWGAPIPIIHCPKDGIVPVPEDQLPVVLPELKSFEPSGDGRSPLANVPEFVNVECPQCGGPAERETDTMDGFACSSWYFLRFADPHNSDKPFARDKADFWLPVDDYIGGAEHAVMHLLYARFWTKVMHDDGLIDFDEPFLTLRNQGMILAPDGQKMSKSKGNTIEPDGLIDQGYGADSTRIMELFIGPWNQSAAWSVEGMGGSFRFLQRVWTLVHEYLEAGGKGGEAADELLPAVHKTIARVSRDLEELGFNTAIAALMEHVNELYKIKAAKGYGDKDWPYALKTLVQLLAPFAPHIAEELWHELKQEGSVHTSQWPVHDPKYLVQDTLTIVVQVNGKVRANLEVPADSTEESITKEAQQNERVQTHLQDKTLVKTIYIPGKLVSFVVK